MHIAKGKKPICKGCILYDSKYMTFWKRQNYGDSKKISNCQRFWGRNEFFLKKGYRRISQMR